MTDPARPSFVGDRLVLHGIGVSAGIVIGKAHLLGRTSIPVARRTIAEKDVAAEVRRFRRAVRDAKEDLQSIRDQFPEAEHRDHLFILDAHVKILEDRMISEEPAKIIRQERINAEAALAKQIRSLKRIFDAIQDPYLRERKADVDHVGERILMHLTGEFRQELDEITHKVVIVAHDLSPADTAQMSPERVAGFLTDVGGPTSHTAIMARALEIPAVVGLENATAKVRSGCPLIVDGRVGKVILYPSRDDYAKYLKLVERFHRFEQDLLKDLPLPTVTLDGVRIHLAANIEMNREIPAVIEHGGEGIGLYRTEYLYMNRDTLPTEDEQFVVYREVAERTAPHTATIRTVDLGGDKFLSRLDLAEEMNPALGLRGIRLCLHDVELFKAQLRAVLRASAFGRLRVMLPLVSSLEEVRRARQIFDETKAELEGRGETFDAELPLGCMVETPASVTVVDLLAGHCDFLSIGTNDLIQYALAIDRVNEHVASLYQPCHPAILRMIQRVVAVGRERGVPVSLCGEMAGDSLYAMLLIGIGLESFSMTPHSIPVIKHIARSVTRAECQDLVAELATMDDAATVLERVKREMSARYPEFFTFD